MLSKKNAPELWEAKVKKIKKAIEAKIIACESTYTPPIRKEDDPEAWEARTEYYREMTAEYMTAYFEKHPDRIPPGYKPFKPEQTICEDRPTTHPEPSVQSGPRYVEDNAMGAQIKKLANGLNIITGWDSEREELEFLIRANSPPVLTSSVDQIAKGRERLAPQQQPVKPPQNQEPDEAP
jgi:hypothetical protein